MTRTRWNLLGTSTLLSLSLGLSGCGANSTGATTAHAQPMHGGTAVIALPVQTSPNWFFPVMSLTADSVVNFQVDEMMYKPLLHISRHDTVNYARSLASSVTWNAAGTRYVVTLNKKWHWSNGQPVTAQDVVFTYNIMKAASSGASSLPWAFAGEGFGGFPTLWKSVVAQGPYQVVITLNAPKNQQWFLRNGINQLIPVPEQVWNKYPDNMTQELKFINSVANSPLSSVYRVVDGPYKFNSYSPNNYWSFVPNPGYDGHRSLLDKVTFQYETSSASEFDALKTGTVNVGYLPPSLLKVRSELTHDVFSVAYSFGFNYLLDNFSLKAPNGIGKAFNSLVVRQALQMGVDQPGIIQHLYEGYGVVDDTTLAPEPPTEFFDPALAKNPYPFNPQAGRELLLKHGWHLVHGVMTKNGIPLSFTLDYASGSQTATDMVQLLKSDWALEGIHVTLVSQPFDTVISDSPSNASQWAMIDWNGGWTYGTDPYPTGGGLFATNGAENSGSYNSQTMNQLIAASYQPGSTKQVLKALYAYEVYAAKQLPAVFVPWIPNFNEHSLSIHGTVKTFDPVGDVLSPNYWWISTSQ
ncbi:ABC transporter substrate-binding protein [Sulfobacillus thermotolerans]|uniref:ABC transporter substrate-binding protein n=1 Tax=Sulfobacillus thermotolerans TaxID=338644 RepID=A0ABM6RQ95_9FIRM|nr:ABC transporter substrate-binding protein [Sulfobacillus thermotolerans]